MIISKKEAFAKGIKKGGLCNFHLCHPDQEGSYSCDKCVIIEDSCGCGEDMECGECRLSNDTGRFLRLTYPKKQTQT